MKNKIAFVYYNASMGLSNPYSLISNEVLYRVFNQNIPVDSTLYSNTKGYGLGFYICTRKENTALRVSGPSKSKKYEEIDYSILLPVELDSLDTYLRYLFEGIGIVTSKYGLDPRELTKIEALCRLELGLGPIG